MSVAFINIYQYHLVDTTFAISYMVYFCEKINLFFIYGSTSQKLSLVTIQFEIYGSANANTFVTPKICSSKLLVIGVDLAITMRYIGLKGTSLKPNLGEQKVQNLHQAQIFMI